MRKAVPRHGGACLRVLFGINLLMLAASPMGAAESESLAEETPAGVSVSTAKVLESLGPGPLIERRDAIDRPRLKAANIEDAIDHCVETNMSSLKAPGAAVAVILDG